MDWSKPPQPPRPSRRPLVDKGFELVYFRLSHRRRFWRTIYFTPLCVPLFFIDRVPGFGQFPAVLIGIACLMGSLAQGGYEYFKWQQERAAQSQPPPVVAPPTQAAP